MKCISLPFRLSDSYNFLASFTSRFRKTVHNGSFLKLYIPSTLKFDRKAEIPPLAPFTSVLHKEQSAATVCIRQHALAETEDNNSFLCYISTSHLLQKIHHYLKLTTGRKFITRNHLMSVTLGNIKLHLQMIRNPSSILLA